MKSFFPDVNVWIALAYRGHQHHSAAAAWFEGLTQETAFFCRSTQLGFLRLLTHPQIMGEDIRSQTGAWEAYDALLSDERVSFMAEPEAAELESGFRTLTAEKHSSSKLWPDAYLSAFARSAGLVLVTFDRRLHDMTGPSSLLLS